MSDTIRNIVKGKTKEEIDIEFALNEKAEELGIDTDKIIYSLNVKDVIQCIADVFEEKALTLTPEQLKYLIDVGVEGTENIDWWSSIEFVLREEIIEK